MAKEFPAELEGFDPFGDLIGLTFTRCEDGFSRCLIEVSEKLLNPHKTLHGGVAYSMADTGMGAALYTRMDEGELCATIEIKIVYFKAVTTGKLTCDTKQAVTSGKLTCDTKLIHRSKKIAALESEIKLGEQLVAKALGTFSIFEDRRSNAL